MEICKEQDSLDLYLKNNHTLVGELIELRKQISNAAEYPLLNVVIMGESGTGKEVVAREIYRESYSRGRKGKFVSFDPASVSESLFHSELYGATKGSYTTAVTAKEGKIRAASNGVLFFDNFDYATIEVQRMLLRIIQERTFSPIGGKSELKTDAQFILATQKPLYSLVKEGKFREDLYYRMFEWPIYLEPLRSRKEDIIPLTEHFLKIFFSESKKIGGIHIQNGKTANSINGNKLVIINPESMDILYNYTWPGNIRELRSCIKYAVIKMEEKNNRFILSQDIIQERLSLDKEKLNTLEERVVKSMKERDSFELSPSLILQQLNSGSYPINGISNKKSNLETATILFQYKLVKSILIETNFDQGKTLEILGIDRRNLTYHLKHLGLFDFFKSKGAFENENKSKN